MQVTFTLSIGYANCQQKEVMTYDDDDPPTDEQLEEEWKQWAWNYIDGGPIREEQK